TWWLGNAAQWCYLWTRCIDMIILIAQICRKAESFTGIVCANRDNLHFTVLMGDTSFAVSQRGVEAHTPCVGRSEAFTNIESHVNLALAVVANGTALDTILGGAFGYQIYCATDARTTRCGAIDECIGTAE